MDGEALFLMLIFFALILLEKWRSLWRFASGFFGKRMGVYICSEVVRRVVWLLAWGVAGMNGVVLGLWRGMGRIWEGERKKGEDEMGWRGVQKWDGVRGGIDIEFN